MGILYYIRHVLLPLLIRLLNVSGQLCSRRGCTMFRCSITGRVNCWNAFGYLTNSY